MIRFSNPLAPPVLRFSRESSTTGKDLWSELGRDFCLVKEVVAQVRCLFTRWLGSNVQRQSELAEISCSVRGPQQGYLVGMYWVVYGLIRSQSDNTNINPFEIFDGDSVVFLSFTVHRSYNLTQICSSLVFFKTMFHTLKTIPRSLL